jgi:outer membrane biosynthesis protein TonB
MPTLVTPPNPAPPSPTDKSATKVRTTKFGELEEHELIHLLDTLDDERERARFRESIYISLFFWIAVAWFVVYGPRVLFHEPRIVNPAMKERELANLNMPNDLNRALHAPRAVPAPRSLDQKTIRQLQQERPAPAPAPLPKPAVQQPAPQQTPPAPRQAQAAPTPLPSAPAPPPPTPALLPSAPAPSSAPAPTRPNFSSPATSAGDMIRQAAQAARGGGMTSGDEPSGPVGRRGPAAPGVDILSDTMGVDFNPYLQKIIREIYYTWLPLIPEEARPPLNKQGETQIRFTILPDGTIGGMTLEASSHDDAINRSSWGSITGVGKFPPLPKEFHGPNLELRIHYLVNKEPPR